MAAGRIDFRLPARRMFFLFAALFALNPAAAQQSASPSPAVILSDLPLGTFAKQGSGSGGSVSYKMVLGSRPSGNVTVRAHITVPTTTQSYNVVGAQVWRDGSGSRDVWTFTPDNWNQPQTVHVGSFLVDDSYRRPNEHRVEIRHSPSGGGYDSVEPAVAKIWFSVPASFPPLLFSTLPGMSSLPLSSVRESDSRTYRVRLPRQPDSRVTVSITAAPGSDGDLTVSKKTLVFTPANWNAWQSVTIRAAVDADVNDGRAIFVHTVQSGPASLVGKQASYWVSETDITDFRRLILSAKELRVSEGHHVSYGVSLGRQPDSRVTVSITAMPDSDGDLTVSKKTLVFTPANWNTPQSVTVRAAVDADKQAGRAVFRHRVLRGPVRFLGSVLSDVFLPALEVELTRELVLSTSSLQVPEGSSVSYRVSLSSRPAGEVRVLLARAPGGDGDLTVYPRSLVFAPGAWNVPQTVVVSGGLDADDREGTAIIAHTTRSTVSGWDGVTESLSVSELDRSRARMLLDTQSVSLIEGESAGDSYTVRLSSRPSAEVVVRLSSDNPDIVVSPSRLLFDRANWGVGQRVLLRALDDTDREDDSALVRHVASGGGYDGAEAVSLSVQVQEDDALLSVADARAAEDGRLAFTVTSDNVAPEGGFGFRYRADSEPGDTAVAGQDFTAVAAAVGGIAAGQREAVIEVALTDDRVDELAEETLTLRIVSVQEGLELADGVAVGTIVDNEDTPSLSVTPAAKVYTEGVAAPGAEREFGVTLDGVSALDMDVTFSVEAVSEEARSADIVFDGSRVLSIAAGERAASGRARIVLPDDDERSEPARVYRIVAVGRNALGVVSGTGGEVRILEDDGGEVEVTPPFLVVDEGSAASFALRLSERPVSDVTIRAQGIRSGLMGSGTRAFLSTASGADADVGLASDRAIVFTPQDWSRARLVGVIVDEDADGANGVSRFDFALQSKDARYGGERFSVEVHERENDFPGLVFDRQSLAVAETTRYRSGSGKWSVALVTEPSAPVKLNIVRGGDTDLSVSPGTLTFTAFNWDTPQRVTVSAATDSDETDGTARFTHTAAADSAKEYAGISGVVTVKEVDTTGRRLIVADEIRVDEGDVEKVASPLFFSFSQPSLARNSCIELGVTVDNPDVVLDSSEFRYCYQRDSSGTVPFTVKDDDDALDETATVTFTLSDVEDSGYSAGVAATTRLYITDNDKETVRNATLSAVAAQAVENAGQFVFEVSSDIPAPEGGIAFDWALSAMPDGVVGAQYTATAGEDFRAASGRARMPAGASVMRISTALGATDGAVIDDTTDERNEIVAFTISNVATQSGAPPARIGAATVRGVIVDNDDSPTVSLSLSRDVLKEDRGYFEDGSGGDVSKVSASLSHPSAFATEVEVTVVPVPGGGAKAGDIEFRGSRKLTIAAGSTRSAGTVAILPVDNDDAVARDRALSVGAKAVNQLGVVAPQPRVLTIRDDDRSFKLSTHIMYVPEGTRKTWRVSLDAQPSGMVVVSLYVYDSARGEYTLGSSVEGITVSPSRLVFTPDDWAAGRAVTVTAAEDDNTVEEKMSVEHFISGAGYDRRTIKEHFRRTAEVFHDYSGRLETLQLRTIDNDLASRRSWLIFDRDRLDVAEGGEGIYSVAMENGPSHPVTVSITVGDGFTARPATLAFNADNWRTAQPVVVSSAEDVDGVDDTATLRHRLRSADGHYSGQIAHLPVRQRDGNRPRLVSSAQSVVVAEGGAAAWKLSLSSRPQSAVVVRVSGTGDADLSVSPESVTFLPQDWNRARVFTVSAAADGDSANGQATFTHTASSADATYAGLTAAVTVTEVDRSRPDVVPDTAELSVTEGGSATWAVRLSAPFAATVTPRSAHPDVSFTPAALSFDTSNWNVAQSFTARVAEDADFEDETARIIHDVKAGADAPVAGTGLALAIRDNDIGLSVAAVAAREGDVLQAPVTATRAAPAGGLAFTWTARARDGDTATAGADFVAAQTPVAARILAGSTTAYIPVVTREDALDEADERFSIAIATQAPQAQVSGAPAKATIEDNDVPPAARLVLDTLTIDEAGGTAQLAAELSHPSSRDTVVDVAVTPQALSGAVAADVRVSGDRKLTIAAGETRSAGTVTLTAVDNDRVESGKLFRISAIARNAQGVVPAAVRHLSIRDDDAHGMRIAPCGAGRARGGHAGSGL